MTAKPGDSVFAFPERRDTPRHMPGKLKILLGMYGINLLLGIVTAVAFEGGWFGVILTALVMGMLFKGNNVMRIIVIVFAVIGLVLSALALLALLGAMALVGPGQVIVPLLSVIWGIVVAVFAVFALTRPDVKAHFGAAAAAAPPQG